MDKISGVLLARLSILTTFEGSEEIECYRREKAGVMRYFRYTINDNDQIDTLYPLEPQQFRALQKVLDFPDPVMRGEKMLGCDGVTYELTLYQNGMRKMYSWWCDAPKGWEPVVKATNALLKAAKVNRRVRTMRFVSISQVSP